MTPALDARFPGWLPGSRAEETKTKADEHGASYRDKQTHARGEIVQITLVPGSSKNVLARASGAMTSYVRDMDLPAYEFKVRRATGSFLAVGGWGGHVVLVAGYWVKVGTGGWDE
jgi:hypothetical protein